MRSERLIPFLLLLLLAAAPLSAHELGFAQVDVMFRTDGTYVVSLPPGNGVAAQARLYFDGKPAQALSGRTPADVSQFQFADDAIPDYFVLRLRSEGRADVITQWVEHGGKSEPYALDRTVVPLGRWKSVRLYLSLGFTHILPRGLDHVLFVLGLFLLALQLRPLLWQISAFTIAHTITLALTASGVVSLPARVVEPLIALSIVYVAVENVFTSKLHAWRPLIVFGFGLLHGMGFAGVLTRIGLPKSEFVPALLAFNAGVELGQLTVIAIAFIAVGLWFRKKDWYRAAIVVPGSLAIAAMGMYWLIVRSAVA